MAPLSALKLPILHSEVLDFFAAQGILSVEDFLVHDLYMLVAVAEYHTSSEVLKQAIAEILSFVDGQHARWLNGAELLSDFQQIKHVLPTGCEGVDSLLRGGLLEGTVTELVGPSSSGKTQICLLAASHIAYHFGATVMYLDTCNSFSSKRIAHFLDVLLKSSVGVQDQQGPFEKVMKRIFHYNVFDIYSMLDLLHQIESIMRTQGNDMQMRLIIVDSVSSVITPILSGNNLQGHSLMITVGGILKKISCEYNVAVLITNHTVVDKRGILRPALGESWKTVPHARLLVTRDSVKNICNASLLKHTSLLMNVEVKVGSNGF